MTAGAHKACLGQRRYNTRVLPYQQARLTRRQDSLTARPFRDLNISSSDSEAFVGLALLLMFPGMASNTPSKMTA